MKIALVAPPILSRYVQSWDEPLGLEYLAATLAPHHDVRIVDAFTRRLGVANTAAEIAALAPEIVGVSLVMTGAYEPTLALCRELRVRLPGATIVLGGHTATFLSDQILARGHVDAIVRGEGEITFAQLVERRERRLPLDDVRGLVLPDRDRARWTPDRPRCSDLDRLPFPARHLVPGIERYELAILTARGCSFGCPYCSVAAFWGREPTRRRSIDNVIAEIAHVVERHGRAQLGIADDTFTLPPRRAREFCERLTVANLGVRWSCTGRIETVRPPLLAAMARAGCTDLFFGIESGSERVLRRLGRKYGPSRVIEVYEDCVRAGIRPRFSFIVGLPGEDREAFEETLRLVDRLEGVSVGVHVLTPLPGTAFSQAPERHGLRVLPHDTGTLDINSDVWIENGLLTREDIRRSYREAVGHAFRAGRRTVALERLTGERR